MQRENPGFRTVPDSSRCEQRSYKGFYDTLLMGEGFGERVKLRKPHCLMLSRSSTPLPPGEERTLQQGCIPNRFCHNLLAGEGVFCAGGERV